MKMKEKIKVLVIDDSLVFRETLAQGLAKDPVLQVVGTAADPYQARDKIIQLRPQVLTLDVEMPRMDGIEFVRKLMPQYPLPVVMVSAVSDKVFEALKAGAVDFVLKPDAANQKGIDSLINELIVKIKIASIAKLGHWKNSAVQQNSYKLESNIPQRKIIALGASTGGTEAIHSILSRLPMDIPAILIVQHMPPVFTKMYAQRLNNSCSMEVKEAENGDIVRPGRVLIAPGDYQMGIKKLGSQYHVECYKGEKVNGHCPSVDILFNSMAETVGSMGIGIILTGMGHDGAKGLLAMRKNGARTIGQDESSSIVYGMPKVAYESGGVEKQVALENIPQAICSLLGGRCKP